MDFPPEVLDAIEKALLARKGSRKTIQGAPHIEFLCIEHDDHNPSAHYHTKKMVWKCRACGAGGGVLSLAKKLGIQADGSHKKPDLRPQRGQKPTATYRYTALDGTRYLKERYEYPDIDPETGKNRKSFAWRQEATGRSGYAEGHSVTDMRLYWLEDPALRPDEPVVFVEGEKTLEAVWQRGILACCGAWGASQTTFKAEVLGELKGRTVWLAPDNDSPGRKYMDALASELRRFCRIRWVEVPLPPKGDLFDFFAAGGKPEAIFDGDMSETAVDYLDDSSIRVRVPSETGPISFLATDLTRTKFGLECKLTVKAENQPVGNTYTTRINLLAQNARVTLRNELGRMFELGPGFNWTVVVNDAVGAIDEAFTHQDVSIDAFDIADVVVEDTLLLGDLLPEGQPTVFFGDGASLKSYIAQYCQVLLALGLPFPGSYGRSAPPRSGLYVDFENVTESVFRRRVRRICEALNEDVPRNRLFYWNGRGIPLIHQLDALKDKIRRENIGSLIVDSAAGAIAGPPEESQPVIDFYQRGLAQLGTTTIVIAHINRQGDIFKPFGSAFWHNFARRTWFVQRGQRARDLFDVAMLCRKVNDGPWAQAKALTVEFDGSERGVYFDHQSFLNVSRELDRLRTMPERITDRLASQPYTAAELGTLLGSKGETVIKYLEQSPDRFVKLHEMDDGGRPYWALKAPA